MPPDALTLPFRVSHRDPSGLFAVETTVTAWREDRQPSPRARVVTLTLGAGTLHDADRGRFPLEGVVLTLRVTDGRIEPIEVRNPGVWSEFQQEGLLDAVTSTLEAGGRPFPPHCQE